MLTVTRNGVPVDVSSAVEAACLHTDYDSRGESREALEIARNCAKAIGLLAEAINASRGFSMRELQDLVAYDYVVED